MSSVVFSKRWLVFLAFVASCFVAIDRSWSQRPAESVQQAFDQMNNWLGDTDNGRLWKRFLRNEKLQQQLALGDEADITVVREVLDQYGSDTPGLDKRHMVAVRRALKNWIAVLSLPSRDKLPEITKNSIDSFRQMDSQEVSDTRRELLNAVTSLEKYLKSGGEKTRTEWHEYLDWSRFEPQLTSETPNVRNLDAMIRRLHTDKPGLELSHFIAVRTSLTAFRNALIFSDPQAKDQYVKVVESLANSLELYETDPSHKNANLVGQLMGWLHHGRQVPIVLEAINHHHTRPNLHVQVSAGLVAAGIEDVVSKNSKIRDNILGTSTTSNVRSNGKITVRLIPDESRSVLEMQLEGQALASTVGRNGSVTIYTTSSTSLSARKQIWIDAEGFDSSRATANCQTRTKVTSISAPSQIVRRAAQQRVASSKRQAESIASRRAEQRLIEEVDRKAGEMLVKSNDSYLEKIRQPLERLGGFPSLLQFRTTDSDLLVQMLQANESQLAASSDPPPLNGQFDLSVRIHESLFNNMAQSVLGGTTLTDVRAIELAERLTGKVPEGLEIQSDEEPWSITFSRNTPPITAEFRDGTLKITIRGRKFTSGDQALKAWDISVAYKIETGAEGLRLVRQGEVLIQPRDFDQRQQKTLSVAETSAKRLLTRKFSQMFTEEREFEGFELPGQWKKAGKLKLVQADSHDQWLTFGWAKSPTDVETVASRPAR